VANEEILADSLISEGNRCIVEGKLTDALHLFEEANQLEKWKDIYGTKVLANLAYICAKLGNMHKAREYINDYYDLYGKSDFQQEIDECQKLNFAQQEIDRHEVEQMILGN
jgi:outer membrane protein assembly factor BamD (BamD/ComL family)